MINLTPEDQAFIEAQVAGGKFQDSSEVVQAALSLLRESNEAIDDIRQGLADAEAGKGRSVGETFAGIRAKLGPAT